MLELTAAGDVAEFIGLIRIDESWPGSMCACCGDPTFEFFEGRKLVAALGYHHGKTLRWPGGDWPGDALLDAAAADRLCEWLAARGVDGPKEERDETARHAAEAKARNAEQDELLGAERIDAIVKAENDGDAAKVFATCFPDRAARLDRLFRLATRESGWGNDSRRDSVVERAESVLLGEEDAAAVIAFLGGKVAEGGAAGAAAAELVDSIRGERFDPVALDALRLAAARFLLVANETHGAVSILEDSKSPAADAVLLSLLPPAGEDGEPRGTFTALHADIAIELAKRCDAALLPRLRAIVKASPETRRRANQLEQFERNVSERPPPAGGK